MTDDAVVFAVVEFVVGATFLGGDFIIDDAVVFAVVIGVKKVEVIDAFIYAGYFLGPSDDMLAFARQSDQKKSSATATVCTPQSPK